MNPKTRHNRAAEAAPALPSIRRAEAMQALLAGAALALTIGSAIITKRITAEPAPLAGVLLDEPHHNAPSAQQRNRRGIPAVSLVQRPKHTSQTDSIDAGSPIIDPLEQSTRDAPIIATPDLETAAVPTNASTPDHHDGTRFYTPPAGYERYYNGRPLRRARTLSMTVTAYSPDHRSCGEYADGITASGMSVWTNAMNLVAADPRILPRNSLITVPGYADDSVVPVLDVGGAIKGSRLDVLYPSHAVARQWGVQRLNITVWEYADE